MKAILGEKALSHLMVEGLGTTESREANKNLKGAVENMYKEFFVLNQNKSDKSAN